MRTPLPALLLLGLLTGFAPPDDGYKATLFYQSIEFRKPPFPDAEELAILERLTRKENWTGAFRSIEEKLGPFVENLSLVVEFGLDGEELGAATSDGPKGIIKFNLKSMVQYQRKIDASERKQKEAGKANLVFKYSVPPVQFDRVVYHELTHVFQRGAVAPAWFNEGMAQWIGDDPNSLRAFIHRERKFQPIDVSLEDRNDIYARGHLFWLWLQSREAARRTAEASVLQQRGWRESAEQGTGLSWANIISIESEWSAQYLEKLKSSNR